MYLKSLELVGFKSFAEKTKLNFEPGMTAIVGPNGCGKSNVSDAIRWVLGEQSAKAMRGSKMEDVIFNGTDTHKPLSLAEVSIALAGCEGTLGTEYDEVTVTRRVLRSGEGQYFINKTGCRLKDIQRLFMDTGIGTNSYSLMEQGRIDLILSARAEDRRGVFEEASGITKYKADKKEAIRKLEQTEANLLRLADIIREVRRRIISLQRQAGKAKRYKELQTQLRALDIYLSRERLTTLASEISNLEARLAELVGQEEALRNEIQQTEEGAQSLRTQLQQKEDEIGQTMDAASRAAAERDRTLQNIQINNDRITELRTLSERDSKDAEDAQSRLQSHQDGYAVIDRSLQESVTTRDDAERDLKQSNERLQELNRSVDEVRHTLNRLRSEAVDLDSRGSQLQNELSDLDARERNSVLRRERLSAELNETKRSLEKFESRRTETQAHLQQLQADVAVHEEQVQSISSERADVNGKQSEFRAQLSDLQARAAACAAKTEMIAQSDEDQEGLPPGARALLAEEGEPLIERSRILGTLAEHIQAKPEYQKALETALRAWSDAVVVRDAEALTDALRALEAKSAGSARLLAAVAPDMSDPLPDLPGAPLIDHVQCTDAARPLAERLLAAVRVVDSPDQIAFPLPARAVLVTRSGLAVGGPGTGEYWQPGKQDANPMTRRHLLAQWSEELNGLRRDITGAEQTLQQLNQRDQALDGALSEARKTLQQSRHNLSVCEGELQVKAEEAKQAADRMETVSFELNALVEQQSSTGDRRAGIVGNIEKVRARQGDVRNELASLSEQLHARENERGEWQTKVTEKRIHLGERRQEVDKWTGQKESLEVRMKELEALINDRRAGLSTYHTRIAELEVGIEQARARVQPLEDEAKRLQELLGATRREREEMTAEVNQVETQLRAKRTDLDQRRTDRSQLEVEVAEQRLRRQTIVERMTQEYHITIEEMERETEPAWENGERPDRETLETTVAELRTKMDSMGPVNLVAIEEHEELEERLNFLTTQQDDLVKAKTQLMDMIRKINTTTTELFMTTFNQVNENFQETFKRLFGGGSAKLVLVNDEDVLDSGIEIIARPPGKKLQTISLLSGGERTMTAVGLLFALYMVKPSPFCVLDELDAALDEANINRFVEMVEGFLTKSQFVIITHNRRTIEAADALYGVTMEKHGISKIMSVKFQKHPEHDRAAAQREEAQAETAHAES